VKQTPLWVIALVLCAACCHSVAVRGQEATPRRGLMQAVIVEKGPPIDGTLKSPVWRKCPPLELGEYTSPRLAPPQGGGGARL